MKILKNRIFSTVYLENKILNIIIKLKVFQGFYNFPHPLQLKLLSIIKSTHKERENK